MNLNKTFFVMGPDEDGDEDIPYYADKMNNIYQSEAPAQKALDKLINWHEKMASLHRDGDSIGHTKIYAAYAERLRTKRIICVKPVLITEG